MRPSGERHEPNGIRRGEGSERLWWWWVGECSPLAQYQASALGASIALCRAQQTRRNPWVLMYRKSISCITLSSRTARNRHSIEIGFLLVSVGSPDLLDMLPKGPPKTSTQADQIINLGSMQSHTACTLQHQLACRMIFVRHAPFRFLRTRRSQVHMRLTITIL
jgi:hypothetical protein